MSLTTDAGGKPSLLERLGAWLVDAYEQYFVTKSTEEKEMDRCEQLWTDGEIIRFHSGATPVDSWNRSGETRALCLLDDRGPVYVAGPSTTDQVRSYAFRYEWEVVEAGDSFYAHTGW